jgi:hypothetical protein
VAISAVGAVGAVFLVAALSGCTSSGAPSASIAPGAPVPTAIGTFNPTLAHQSQWLVSGGGSYFTGAAVVCDLELPFAITDSRADVESDRPQYSLAVGRGTVAYNTVWPHDVPGTGIDAGSGSYTVRYDPSGLPTTLTASTTIDWRDPKAATLHTKRTDKVTLTFEKQPRDSRCSY